MTLPSGLALHLRISWFVVLFAHLVLAGLVLAFMPHGFPILHPRFVLGLLAPLCLALVSLSFMVGLLRAPRAAARFLPVLPAFWGALALGLLLVFPKTGVAAAWPLSLLALCLALSAGFTCRHYGLREWLPATLLGVTAGLLLSRCERPAPPSTHPSREVPPRRADSPVERVPLRAEVASDLVVEGAWPRVTWRGQRVSIAIAPALEFDRTPADGFWSIFAANRGPSPNITLASMAVDALRLWSSDGMQRLHVQRDNSPFGSGTRVVRLEAWTALEQPIYSHLNAFTTVEITGHRRLGLRFSPGSSPPIEVTHADYPRGAPARFAYVDAERRFRVVQAADAEKGPFTTLAQGMLGDDAALEIEFVELSDPPQAFARLELLDFAAQLSTALSPTAGYGVAENAIEFGLASPDPSSSAQLSFTLAASGVGRGWDSVGHRAGAYRNRMILSSLEPAPAEPAEIEDPTLARACAELAREIAALRPSYPQLAAFEPIPTRVHRGECSINYSYRTHDPTERGGWRAQVPSPDPDGLWFHVAVWDPAGPSRSDQINTQAGFSVFAYGDKNITVLVLDGAKNQRFAAALWRLLRRRGLGQVRR